MKVIIDRIEENFAIVELNNKNTVDIPIILIPKEAKEGDVINISIDKDETEKRKEKIEEITKDLWE